MNTRWRSQQTILHPNIWICIPHRNSGVNRGSRGMMIQLRLHTITISTVYSGCNTATDYAVNGTAWAIYFVAVTAVNWYMAWTLTQFNLLMWWLNRFEYFFSSWLSQLTWLWLVSCLSHPPWCQLPPKYALTAIYYMVCTIYGASMAHLQLHCRHCMSVAINRQCTALGPPQRKYHHAHVH